MDPAQSTEQETMKLNKRRIDYTSRHLIASTCTSKYWMSVFSFKLYLSEVPVKARHSFDHSRLDLTSLPQSCNDHLQLQVRLPDLRPSPTNRPAEENIRWCIVAGVHGMLATVQVCCCCEYFEQSYLLLLKYLRQASQQLQRHQEQRLHIPQDILNTNFEMSFNSLNLSLE